MNQVQTCVIKDFSGLFNMRECNALTISGTIIPV